METIQEAYLYMLRVERQFSEHTLKSYYDDIVQFKSFLEQE
ncbi:tyrosine recombinase XerC, partial [Staphylococcus arlettae]